MRKLETICLGLLLSLSVGAQDPPPGTSSSAPVRVPGQPNSPEELLAMNQLMAAPSPVERIRLGDDFLATYPNSGLSSYVHLMLANAHGMSDPEKYAYHGEIALREIPSSPSVLANLAFIYAETNRTALGAERGKAALELIQEMQKPAQLAGADWLGLKLEVGGQSNYAIGRHLLGEATPETPESAQKLEQASQYLLRAVEQIPDDPYSSFRLGEVYLQLQNLDQALAYFARTAAVGGSVGEIARERLQELYQSIHSNTDDLPQLLAAQAAALEKARAARKAMLEVFMEKPGTPPGY